MRLNAELEQKVEERTLASKENTDARLRFLANMIHEIRNPINSVMLLTGLIEKTPMDSEQCQIYIRRIATATRNGSELINDILDFSKIEALQIPLQQEIFKPAEMFEDLKAMYMKPASQKGLEMRMITPDSTLKVIGDRKRLFQVLSNLVSNATKFTESGHIAALCSVKALIDGHCSLQFEVEDTGIGIDSTAQELIFDPFAQANSSINRRFGGTGLGLSIAKSLVSLMGGSLSIQSLPEVGTVFAFTLTFQMANGFGEGRVDQATEASLEGIRILIVDDDLEGLHLLAVFLRNHGANVSEAHNGQEDIHFLQSSPIPFDVVLMDVQIPVMDGLDARA